MRIPLGWLYAGLLYCSAIWGATFFIVKASLALIPAVPMVALRFLISAACLLPWVLRRRKKTKHLGEAVILAFWLSALYLTQTQGLEFTSAANSGFITGLFLFFVPLFLFIFYRKSTGTLQWLAVLLAIIGLWIMTGGVQGFNRGDALTLVSAMAYAAHVLATDRYVKGHADLLLLAFHQFWMTGVIALVWSLMAGSFPVSLEGRAWGAVAFLGLLPTLSAFFIQMHAQKHIAPLKVSLMFTLEPVFAALFAWTLGGETAAFHQAAGGFLIVGAMFLGELAPWFRSRRSIATP